MWQLTSWYPVRRSSILNSYSSKAILTFLISWNIASHHSVLPFYLSSDIASLTDLDITNKYLWVKVQYFDFNFEMIRFLFFINCGTHHTNVGSWEIRIWWEYSAICNGYYYFTYLMLSHAVEPYFHWIIISQPLVVSLCLLPPLFEIINVSWCMVSVPPTGRSTM